MAWTGVSLKQVALTNESSVSMPRTEAGRDWSGVAGSDVAGVLSSDVAGLPVSRSKYEVVGEVIADDDREEDDDESEEEVEVDDGEEGGMERRRDAMTRA